MTAFDGVVLGVFLISLSLGLWRGLVYEVLSLLGWPLAFVSSRMFAGDVVAMMPGMQEAMRTALAYVVVFIVTLIVWAIVVWLLSRLVKAAGLGWLDRILGGIFGIVRGALVVLVLVWLAGLTQIPEHPSWRAAKTSKIAEDAALLTKAWLPGSIASRIRYGVRG